MSSAYLMKSEAASQKTPQESHARAFGPIHPAPRHVIAYLANMGLLVVVQYLY